MKKIVHIIANDKFTDGYIEFMKNNMNKYQHVFMGIINKCYTGRSSTDKFLIIEKKKKFFSNEIFNLLKSADKIIVSGIFLGIDNVLLFLPQSILNKTYLQFWGGDFYCYRNTKIFSRKNIKKIILKMCIKRCAGIINLIPSDYDELIKIFPNQKKHFVASIRGSDREMNEYKKYIDIVGEKNKIIVGNSATPENHHIEVFKMLEHFKNEKIKIVCPLSYGDNEYAKKVIQKGKEMFGDKFIAITEFMKYTDYICFLSTFSIGIFYNDRQQAMGNINNLIKMGKKIYLRKDTSMWKDYNDNMVKVFNAQNIKNMTFNQFNTFNVKDKNNNYQQMIKRENKYDSGWNSVLGD